MSSRRASLSSASVSHAGSTIEHSRVRRLPIKYTEILHRPDAHLLEVQISSTTLTSQLRGRCTMAHGFDARPCCQPGAGPFHYRGRDRRRRRRPCCPCSGARGSPHARPARHAAARLGVRDARLRAQSGRALRQQLDLEPVAVSGGVRSSGPGQHLESRLDHAVGRGAADRDRAERSRRRPALPQHCVQLAGDACAGAGGGGDRVRGPDGVLRTKSRSCGT